MRKKRGGSLEPALDPARWILLGEFDKNLRQEWGIIPSVDGIEVYS
jgi:hypothetical protein